MKQILIVFWLILHTNIAMSQYQISGVIYNSENIPVIDCEVYFRQPDSLFIGSTVSDANGRFSFNSNQSQCIVCFSSFTTYDTCMSKELLPGNNVINFYLKSFEHILDEVIIKADPAIENKGDSTVFNKKYFEKAIDNSIGDVIRHIPGFVFDERGIYYKGQKITNINIGGHDIFSGDANALNTAIHKDNIEDITIILKKNTDNQENFELYLPLKEQSKSRINGNAELKSNIKRWNSDILPYFINDKYGIRTKVNYRKDDGKINILNKSYNKWENLAKMAGETEFGDYSFMSESDLNVANQNDDLQAEINFSNNGKKMKLIADTYFGTIHRIFENKNEVFSNTHNSSISNIYSGVGKAKTLAGNFGVKWDINKNYTLNIDLPVSFTNYNINKLFDNKNDNFINAGKQQEIVGQLSIIRYLKKGTYNQVQFNYNSKLQHRELNQIAVINLQVDSLYQKNLYRNNSIYLNERFHITIDNYKFTFNIGYRQLRDELTSISLNSENNNYMKATEIPSYLVSEYDNKKLRITVKAEYPLFIQRFYSGQSNISKFFDYSSSIKYNFKKTRDKYIFVNLTKKTNLPSLYQWDSTLIYNDFKSGISGMNSLDKPIKSLSGTLGWNYSIDNYSNIYLNYKISKIQNYINFNSYQLDGYNLILLVNDSLTTIHSFNTHYDFKLKGQWENTFRNELFISKTNSINSKGIHNNIESYSFKINIETMVSKNISINNTFNIKYNNFIYKDVINKAFELNYVPTIQVKLNNFRIKASNYLSYSKTNENTQINNSLNPSVSYSISKRNLTFFIQGNNVLDLNPKTFLTTKISNGSIENTYYNTIPGYILIGIQLFR